MLGQSGYLNEAAKGGGPCGVEVIMLSHEPSLFE
jgi:hypothetical protein